MPQVPYRPYLVRLCIMRCRLSYAQIRIAELEQLLKANGVPIPDSTTKVPSSRHNCFR